MSTVIAKNEATSAQVRAYLKDRPAVVDAQPDAADLWKNLNGRGRLSPRVEAVYRKATKSKKVLARLAPSDLVTLQGPKGEKVVVSGAEVRKAVGAKSRGRLSFAQREAAYAHFAAQG